MTEIEVIPLIVVVEGMAGFVERWPGLRSSAVIDVDESFQRRRDHGRTRPRGGVVRRRPIRSSLG